MKSKWEQDKPGIRLQHRLEAKLCRDWSPDNWQDVTVLVAVSGGADSVALMRGLARLKKTGSGELHVAHLNHGLRGNEALADEAFVQKLSQSLGIPCHVGHANVHALATARGDGIEEAARTARYAFMEETAARIGARFVATAHTSDDQLETILYRILRGTGISGLCGIPSFRRLNDLTTLVRPLLDVSRSEVMAYLEVIGQTHRTDSSNLNLNHMRNRIRHDLLPLLTRDYHTRVGESILRLGELAGEVQRVTNRQVDSLWSLVAVSQTPDRVVLHSQKLEGVDSYLVGELLIRIWREQNWPRQSMGFDQWTALAVFVCAAPVPRDNLTLPGGIRASRAESAVELKMVTRS